ncbi:hypothetical protein DMI65_03760 [Escherichia coli]|nr:hypothetical protein [Escherichia coli]
MVTNCTYDGVCYNAKEAQDLLEKPPIVCTLTKPGTAMHVSTRSMPITMPCAANPAITTVLLFSPPTPPTNCWNALSQPLIFMYVKVVGD